MAPTTKTDHADVATQCLNSATRANDRGDLQNQPLLLLEALVHAVLAVNENLDYIGRRMDELPKER